MAEIPSKAACQDQNERSTPDRKHTLVAIGKDVKFNLQIPGMRKHYEFVDTYLMEPCESWILL